MNYAEKMAEREFPKEMQWLNYGGGSNDEYVDMNEGSRTAYVKGWEADKWIRVEDELPELKLAEHIQVWHTEWERPYYLKTVYFLKPTVYKRYSHWQYLSPPKTK
jgi:hypothetical protein